MRGEVRGVHLRLSFPGANPHPRLEPFHRLGTRVSYFLGNDPTQWHAAVPVWGGVRYVGLYPGVDLELVGAGGQLQWRLVTQPGADLSQVGLGLEGAEEVELEGEQVGLRTLGIEGGMRRAGVCFSIPAPNLSPVKGEGCLSPSEALHLMLLAALSPLPGYPPGPLAL